MRGMTVRVALVMVALVAVLYLPTQYGGAQEAVKFDLEKAITGAKTPADHEAIASYYDREAAAAKAKAERERENAKRLRAVIEANPKTFTPNEKNQTAASRLKNVLSRLAKL